MTDRAKVSSSIILIFL